MQCGIMQIVAFEPTCTWWLVLASSILQVSCSSLIEHLMSLVYVKFLV